MLLQIRYVACAVKRSGLHLRVLNASTRLVLSDIVQEAGMAVAVVGDGAAMTALWPNETGRDANAPVAPSDEADWLWCRAERFRLPEYFSGLRVCSLPYDADRKRTAIRHIATS